jgi:hypothetical protein
MVTQAPESIYYPGFRYIEGEDGQMPIGVLVAKVLGELAEQLDELAAQRDERS